MRRPSLPAQIVLAVLLGIALGFLFPEAKLKPLGDIGKAIIHWVKLIAGPFLFLTIAASIAEVRVRAGQGLRLVLIAVFNTSIAILIGIGLAEVFLKDLHLSELAAKIGATVAPPQISLGFQAWIKTLMPPSLFSPFVQNEILLIALLALLTGIAIRRAYPDSANQIAHSLEKAREIPAVLLRWLIAVIPLAVLTVVASSVSEFGLSIFSSLLQYVGVVLIGLTLQVMIVYSFWIFVAARMRPSEFWNAARVPVVYAFGVNSSLATLPLTLKALKDLGVSARSASLGAGVATNLNNDGVVLYEAMAVIFVAQLSGYPLEGSQMFIAALACIVASMGITGVPEAGFISLSVVVATLGLPAESLPLLLAVDWIVARARSVVNVLSDMTLSIAMDATERNPGP